MDRLTNTEKARARAALARAGAELPPSVIEIPAYYVRYVFGDGRASAVPSHVDFEFTFRCSMYCEMCPRGAARRGLPRMSLSAVIHTGKQDVLADERYRALRRAVKERALFPQGTERCVRTDRSWNLLPNVIARPPLPLLSVLER